jgi:hypothetical protein
VDANNGRTFALGTFGKRPFNEREPAILEPSRRAPNGQLPLMALAQPSRIGPSALVLSTTQPRKFSSLLVAYRSMRRS